MSTIIDGSAGITFPNSTVQASAGVVLQVVNGTTSTQVSSSTTTYADTGLTATITPKFATSKILVLVNQTGIAKSPANTGSAVYLRLLRNGNQLAVIGNAVGFTNTASYNYNSTISTSYLDSPATTSAVTYKTQFANNASVDAVYVQVSSEPTSTITLLEIAG